MSVSLEEFCFCGLREPKIMTQRKNRDEGKRGCFEDGKVRG
jgi:hypothetical protein